MAEKDKELSSGVDAEDTQIVATSHHVTDTDSFVRDVVAKELIDLKRCRENIKEKLMGQEDSEEHQHHHKSVTKRRVSLGGRANHILDARHELSLTKEQSLLNTSKVKMKRRPRTVSPKKRSLRSGEIVHRKGGMVKFGKKTSTRLNGSSRSRSGTRHMSFNIK